MLVPGDGTCLSLYACVDWRSYISTWHRFMFPLREFIIPLREFIFPLREFIFPLREFIIYILSKDLPLIMISHFSV